METVIRYLNDKGVAYDVIPHPRTYTSAEEAKMLSVDPAGVAKSVMLKTSDGYRLAVLPADRRVDMHVVRDAIGDPDTRLASEYELDRDFPDIELGALPPIGSLLDVAVLVDPDVIAHRRVIFAAGFETESILMSTKDLFEGEQILVLPLSKSEDEEFKASFG